MRFFQAQRLLLSLLLLPLAPILEENEFIECFTVPLKDLYTECRRLEKEGYAIDARVGTLAEGFELVKKWKFL